MKKNKISKNWVNKQRRDTYVKQSKVDGYRARSAYKLIEIDEKFKIFKGGISVIDIGAAPGSWSQYSAKAAKSGALPPEGSAARKAMILRGEIEE